MSSRSGDRSLLSFIPPRVPWPVILGFYPLTGFFCPLATGSPVPFANVDFTSLPDSLSGLLPVLEQKLPFLLVLGLNVHSRYARSYSTSSAVLSLRGHCVFERLKSSIALRLPSSLSAGFFNVCGLKVQSWREEETSGCYFAFSLF